MTDDPFARITALGYGPLLPIIPHDATLSPRSSLHKRLQRGKDSRGKSPGVRLLTGEWTGVDWMRLESTAAMTSVWASWGAGVGLRLDTLAALDSDTMDKDRACAVLAALQRHVPGAHRLRFGRKPKFLVLLRVPVGTAYRRVQFADGDAVELLTAGRQCVMWGIHPVTGELYEWVGGVPAQAELLEASAAQLDALFADLATLPGAGTVVAERAAAARRDVDQDQLRGPLELVRTAVAALPNTTSAFPTRSSYVAVGVAIKAALPDHPAEAFELYEDWCNRWEDPPDDAGEPAPVDDWARMHPPFEIGANWIYDQAAAHGFDKSAVFFAPIATEETAPPASSPAVVPMVLIGFHEAADRALTVSSRPLVKRLLDASALSVFYGPSGQYKTFLVMDLALHVALGRPWAGHTVPSAVPVLYVAGEGAVGANKRAAALRQAYGISRDQDVPFFFRMSSLDLLRADADLRPLIATIQAIPDLGLVVLDTLSRAMAGGDENASTDMGAMVRHLDLIRAETGAHVLAVHHTGKDVAKGARGHSLLRAATDTEVEINEGVFAVTKQREIETTLSLAFAPQVVTLGTDGEGAAVTSVVMKIVPAEAASLLPASAEIAKPGVATPAEAIVLQAVGDAAATAPGAVYAATIDEVLDRAKALGSPVTYETLRTHLRRLLDKRLVARKGRGRWALAAERASNGVFD